MKKVFAMILAVVMTVMLFGCAPKADTKIIGTWHYDIDALDYLMEGIAESVGESQEAQDILEYIDLASMNIRLVCRFEEETYSFTVDEALLRQELDGVVTACMDGITEYVEALLASYGLDMSVQEVMEMVGLDPEELINTDMLMESFDLDSIRMEGRYKAYDGKLYISENVDEEPDMDKYDEYTLEGDSLTMPFDTAQFDGVVPDSGTLTFYRAS